MGAIAALLIIALTAKREKFLPYFREDFLCREMVLIGKTSSLGRRFSGSRKAGDGEGQGLPVPMARIPKVGQEVPRSMLAAGDARSRLPVLHRKYGRYWPLLNV